MVSLVKGVRRLKKLAVSIGVLVLLVILLAVCGGSSGQVGLAGGASVRVNKNAFRITSSIKTFTPGVRYHFIIRNNEHRAHTFIVAANPFSLNLAFSK
ncbi:MAG TPA: hypothetical protein VGM01_13780 [Ktedonobacteraceae bacterium]|jgi:hypothetical protein